MVDVFADVDADDSRAWLLAVQTAEGSRGAASGASARLYVGILNPRMAMVPAPRKRRMQLVKLWAYARGACRPSRHLPSFLADIEHNRTVPSLERLQQIAEAAGLDARGLLTGVRRGDH